MLHMPAVGLRLVLILGFLWPTSVVFAGGWENVDEENGIRSFRKEVEGSDVKAFKGIATINAPIEKVAWVLFDNEHRTKWVDKLQTSVVLEKKAKFHNVIYQVFGLPWPVNDRDYVYDARAYWKGEKLVLALKSTKHPKAPQTIGVRANLKHSYYYLTPKGENKTHVVVEIHTDPMGSLPSWLVNIIQKKWPIKTLSGIRQMVEKPFVGLATLPEKPGAQESEVPGDQKVERRDPAAEAAPAVPAEGNSEETQGQ